MTTAITELEGLIQMLEAEIPANPATPRNERLARQVEKDAADYFKALETAMPWDAIEQLYYRNVEQG